MAHYSIWFKMKNTIYIVRQEAAADGKDCMKL